MIKMYFIRHGRQDSTLCNVDVPLAEAGRRQSELLGERLKRYNINLIYSSDYLRAVETADIINRHIDAPHLILSDLREIDFGDLTGLDDNTIHEKYSDFLHTRDKYLEDVSFPGGENGYQVYLRMCGAVKNIISECQNRGIDSVAIVSHGGAIRAFLAGVLGMPQQNRLLLCKTFENTSISEIDYREDLDRYYVERVNDYAHLENTPELLRKYFK